MGWKFFSMLVGNPRRALAAKIITPGSYFVTNELQLGFTHAMVYIIPVGTGLYTSYGPVVKPAGPGSVFPYGFNVTPDRPLAVPLEI